DLKVEDGLALRIEPHPRFYLDPTETVPIAVPALIRRWWPMLNFVVFKSPAEGRMHIFRPGEPFAQVIVIPAESEFELVEMREGESAKRERQGKGIHGTRYPMPLDPHCVPSTNTESDGTYRHIHRAARDKARKQGS